jgi:TPR repeat protein
MTHTLKKNLFSLLLLVLSMLPLSASADWALSPETKALITEGEAGNIEAQFQVGVAYDSGKGAPHDKKNAMKWYRMAADGAHAEAQNSLGSMYQERKAYKDALFWYEEAASQGHAQATNSVAYLYDMGLGVRQDRKKSFELYSQAANLGWVEAMWNIANIYGAGQIGPVDERMACVWVVRALRFVGPDQSRLSAYMAKILPRLENGLTPDDRASCREQGENWSPADKTRTD